MPDRLAEIRARLDELPTNRPWHVIEISSFIPHVVPDMRYLMREIEQLKHLAEHGLFGVCWCDAPRHDCCNCPGVQDDD